MYTQNFLIDQTEIEVLPKNDINHEDMNPEYMRARIMSDASLIDKQEKLRKAQKELNEYEEAFEDYLPKTMKLIGMKMAALDAIDQNYFINRDTLPRSKQEEENLKLKVKRFENMTGQDMTPLLHSEEKEQDMIKRHRKAFDTYKSYSFLKAGLDKTKLEKSMTSEDDQEQYRFPTADDVANRFISKKSTLRLMTEPDIDFGPGRKFKFIPPKSYLDLTDRPIYSFNDEMKRKYPYDSLSNVPFIRMHQEALEEEYQEQMESQDARHLEDKELEEKQLKTGEKNIKIFKDPKNPLVEGDMEDRLDRYEYNMNNYRPDGYPIWGSQQLRQAMKDETKDYSPKQLKSRIKKLRAIREGKNKPSKEETKASETTAEKPQDASQGEKWKPDSKADTDQPIRDKVYSEYLDTVKASSLERGSDLAFQKTDFEFAKKYEKAVIEKNINTQSGEPFRLSYDDKDYQDRLSTNSRIVAFLKAKDKFRKRNRRRDDFDQNKPKGQEFFMYKNKEIEREKKIRREQIAEFKLDDEVIRLIEQNKNELSKANEEFLYRYNHSLKSDKNQEENQRNIKLEENYQFGLTRTSTNSQKDINEFSKRIKNNVKLTDREYKDNYLNNLKFGTIDEGLKIREKELPIQHDKTLAEVAHSSDPDYQNIYKKYTSYKEEDDIKDRESEIVRREASFTDAVMKEQEKFSSKNNLSFQKYEDYKKAIKEEGEEFFNYPVESPEESGMTRREFLARIWSGRITNKQFEEYMYDVEIGRDKFGVKTKALKQKERPGAKRQFISEEDRLRISKEDQEEYRRRAVLDGRVTEEDSYRLIEKLGEAYQEKYRYCNNPSNKAIMNQTARLYEA